MAKAHQDLPDDIDALKALLVAKDNHIAILEEKLRLASVRQFGASSEKANDDQLGLFNEAEEAVSAPDDTSDAVNVTVVGGHTPATAANKCNNPADRYQSKRECQDVPLIGHKDFELRLNSGRSLRSDLL